MLRVSLILSACCVLAAVSLACGDSKSHDQPPAAPPPSDVVAAPGAEPEVTEPTGVVAQLEPPGPPLKDIAPHAIATCAVTAEGRVRCWGELLSKGEVRLWTEIEAIDNAAQVALGDIHRCILDSEGTVRCWGANYAGQLGGAFKDREPMRLVTARMPPARHIAARGNATCAVTRTGEVYCWGELSGLPGPVRKPTRIAGVSAAQQVSVGSGHACAVTDKQTVYCWGERLGAHLQCEDTMPPDSMPETEPLRAAIQPFPFTGVVDVATGSSWSCVIHDGGRVTCWGFDFSAYILAKKYACRRDLHSVTDAVAIDASSQHACLARKDGSVLCWGVGVDGELGDGSTKTRSQVLPVRGLADARDVMVGEDVSCALRADGSAACWGNNTMGALRPDRERVRAAPVRVELPPASRVIAFHDVSCAVTDQGLSCWGGFLGPERGMLESARPQRVTFPGQSAGQPVRDLAGSRYQLYRLDAAGDLYSGTLPPRERSRTHNEGPHEIGVVEYRQSGQMWCARRENGAVTCWGMGESHPLGPAPGSPSGPASGGGKGTSATAQASIPRPVPEVRDAVALGGAKGRMCAVLASGGLRCWRERATVEVPGTRSPIAPLIAGVDDAVQVVELERGGMRCIRRRTGQVACANRSAAKTNEDASSAVADTDEKPVMADVGLSGIAELVAGDGHVCARDQSGAVWCWGDNSVAQLASLQVQESVAPVRIAGVQATHVAAGDNHTCARTSAGQVYCWGDDSSGQIGQVPDGTVAAPMVVSPEFGPTPAQLRKRPE